ncbi:MAG: phosphoribosylanthranilate isomerase [Pseudomonadota bacterium]|nr:phosphoribosylanthranilate isomerase [Pseudomonadota bacterium]
MNKTKIKFCGLTNTDDVKYALDLDIDYLGLVFVKSSPRYIDISKAEEIYKICNDSKKLVGVFMNQSEEFINNILRNIQLNLLQFHGQEESEMCNSFKLPYIKTIHLTDQNNFNINYKKAFAFLLDSKGKDGSGGTGIKFDWETIKTLEGAGKQLFVAGGLNHTNVKELVLKYKPWGIDVSSGIELEKRKKSHSLMKKFVENVRMADSEKNEKK